MNNITFDPSLNRRETPAMSPVGVPKIDPDKQVMTLTPRDPAPLARSMEEMWNDPHYAALYTNEGWFRRYTQQVGFEEINGLPEFPEMAKGMLNRAFLSDVWGVSPAEIDDVYPFYQGAFAQSVLGRPVTSERDFAQGVQDKFDESTSPAVEIAARIGRGGVVGVHETRAGFYSVINSLVRGQRNPYVDKTVAEARQDVPRLRKEIAEAEAYIKLRLKSQPRGFVPPAGSPAARIGDLRHQLSLAELAAKGQAPENILGSLSRATRDLTEESVENQEAAEKLFDDQISTAHDDQWAMRVADSMGQSAAGTATTMLNPVLGMSLVYSQTFQASRAEYQAVARERGLDASDEAADRYAHEQAMIQTPFELVGDVAIAKTMKVIFKSIPANVSKAGPETFGHWVGERAKDAAKSTAGEVLITTPSQTLAESLLAEGMGVRDETTWGEKGLSTLDAMSIALGQSVGMNGGSIAIGSGIKTIKGDFDGRTPKPNTMDEVPPKGGKFDPEVKPGGFVELGVGTRGVRFSKADDTPSQIGREWLELARDERTQQRPTSTARDLPTVLKETMTKDASDVTIKESRAMNGSIDGYDFVDPDGKVIQVRDYVENEVYLDTSDAGKHRTGIYQSIYSWAHNNGRKVVEDPGGMSHVAQLRRASQMLSSALRFGTTKHMEPGIDGNIAGWREGDSVEATEHNVGLLALKEAELVKQRLPQLMTIRYDGDSQSFYDGEYRIPDQDLKSYIEARIRELDSKFAEGVGPATLRRALATLYAAEHGSRSSDLVLVGHAGAPQSLQRIRYALSSLDPTRDPQEVSHGGEKERSSSAAESGRSGQETRNGSPAPGGESSPISGGTGSERSGSESAVANKNPEVSRVERLLDGLQSSWRSKLKTQVHASVSEISDPKLRAGALEAGNVEAFFDPSDGSIHIIADRVGGLADAERLLRHEGIHWAFAGPLRGEYLGLLDDIRRLVPEDRWKELSERYAGHSEAAIVEEYLAYEGQNNPTSTAWRSFVYEAKRLLRKVFGDKVEFTDADIAALLHKANRKLERGTSGEALGAPLADQEVSYSKKGQGRTSLDDVEVGDDFNAVKKFLPRNEDAPQLLDFRGSPEEVYQRAADLLTKQPVIVDPDGLSVLIANPEGNADKTLLKRAKHLSASKEDRYKSGERVFDADKAKWIPNISKTVGDYGFKIKHYDDVAYVRKYRDGTLHVVFVENGRVVGQTSYDAAVVSQRSLDATKGLKGATILKKREALPSQDGVE